MSEADKLFEEIGYKTEFEDKISFTFANREKGRYITFIKDSKTLMLPCELTMQELKAINLKCKELGWIIEDTFYQDNRKGIKRFQKITLYEDGISDILKLLNIFEKLQKEIEHQKEKRENQKVELAILNEKQKEMNKLKNTVSSYYGMFKKQEKQIKELQKEKEEKDKEIETLKRDFKIVDQECSRLERKEAKQDKIIDLMAERIEWLCKRNGILLDREYNENFTQEDIKQYFERKVKKCTEDG